MEARILERLAAATGWQHALEYAQIGRVLGIGHMLVARVWRRPACSRIG